MRGNHFLEMQSRASRNREDVARRKTPPDQPKTGTTACTLSYDLMILGNPTGGDVTIAVSRNAVIENIVIPYDSTQAEVKALIDAHAEFVADAVECTVTSAGDLPFSNMLIGLPSGSAMAIDPDNTLGRRAGGFFPTANLFVGGCQ